MIFSLARAEPVELPLASNGKSLQAIVVSPDASAEIKAVAEELRNYMNRINGAEFQVESGDGSRGIVLGTLAPFQDFGLETPLEMRGPFGGREAWNYGTGAGQTVEVAAGQHATLLVEPHNMNHLGAMTPAFFYVPKGTRIVYFYWEATPSAHRVFDPDGKEVMAFQVYREIVNVPIPASQDGKVWSLGGPAFGIFHLRFYNAPNVVASTPSDLMVPRELAAEEGLKILTVP